MSSVAGGLAYFLPAAQLALDSTGQVIRIPTPSPTDLFTSPSPSQSPSPAAVTGAFTVLLLGSDDDSKFSSDHVLTQSMILVRVIPSTKQVTMLSIPRDLYVHLSTGGSDRKSTRLNSSHPSISYAVFCLKKKKNTNSN